MKGKAKKTISCEFIKLEPVLGERSNVETEE
jgi:hypothetical protein